MLIMRLQATVVLSASSKTLALGSVEECCRPQRLSFPTFPSRSVQRSVSLRGVVKLSSMGAASCAPAGLLFRRREILSSAVHPELLLLVQRKGVGL